MNDEILKLLLDKIITKEDALELAEKFDLFEKQLFSRHADWKELLSAQIRPDFYNILSNASDEKELISIFKKFQESVSSFDIARLDIAFEPTYEFLLKISEWIAREAGHKVILDINVSKTLIGGLQISFNGHFADASIEKKIKDSLH